jgi:hypothetical protein
MGLQHVKVLRMKTNHSELGIRIEHFEGLINNRQHRCDGCLGQLSTQNLTAHIADQSQQVISHPGLDIANALPGGLEQVVQALSGMALKLDLESVHLLLHLQFSQSTAGCETLGIGLFTGYRDLNRLLQNAQLTRTVQCDVPEFPRNTLPDFFMRNET